ncbi:unnamed protein product [Owenia fusiformis]|uniref:Uncharacterized protein n=1 Tax=Owenia fusiformis TaxID=6347 RepID=A0A8J1UV48_OWEFU|nr:unnamed protein product [Owenia fusiformis]
MYECTLDEKDLQKAKAELNENPKTRLQDVQKLREMVQGHKGLKVDTSDSFLLRFLRARKFNIQRAFDNIVRYCSIRNEYPDVFDKLSPRAGPNDVKQVLDDGFVTVLPGLDKERRKVLVFRPGRWDPEKYPITMLLRTNIVCIEQLLLDESMQVNGIVIVNDLNGMTMSKAYNIGPTYMKKASAVIQEAMPIRMKGMNMVNEPSVVGYLFGLLKMFLKPKLLDRISFHAYDMKSLHKNIQPEILPEEYEGTAGPLNNKEWIETLNKNQDYFERIMGYRLEEVKDLFGHSGDLGGVTGTFKKLNVD